jgi:hypothetical protein
MDFVISTTVGTTVLYYDSSNESVWEITFHFFFFFVITINITTHYCVKRVVAQIKFVATRKYIFQFLTFRISLYPLADYFPN